MYKICERYSHYYVVRYKLNEELLSFTLSLYYKIYDRCDRKLNITLSCNLIHKKLSHSNEQLFQSLIKLH